MADGEVRGSVPESLRWRQGEARRELGAYFPFYNNQNPRQALGYRTPGEVLYGIMNVPGQESNRQRQVHQNGCWCHWQKQRDSRLIPL